MRLVPRTVVAALLVAAVPPPAHAAGALTLDCELTYVLDPGTWDGSGTCVANGVVANGLVVNGHVELSFTVEATTAPICISDWASGSMSGAVDASFFWARTGPLGTFRTNGQITGDGTASFVAVMPLGNPCGGPALQRVVVTVAGE